MKLSKKQIDVIQIVSGILIGALLWWSILFSTQTSDGLLGYLFIIIAVVVIIGARKIESKFSLKLLKFRIALMAAIAAGIIYTGINLLINK